MAETDGVQKPKRTRKPKDAQMHAAQRVIEALRPLDASEREKVLRAAGLLLDLNLDEMFAQAPAE